MKVMIVGSGGREHALGWKLAGEADHELFFVPGNGGTSQIGRNVNVSACDLAAVRRSAEELRPDLIVVGPEDPLAGGMVDDLARRGFLVFGPSKAAAKIESSKIFAKEMMSKCGIPTAPYKVFTSAGKAHAHIDRTARPLVVKADGLARGKGAVVCKEKAQAHQAVKLMMEEGVFGKAGSTVLIEDCLRGEEASVLAITDGEKLVILPPSQDHKAIFDRDRGPNTGGMGAYSPAPLVDGDALDRVEATVFRRLLKGLAREGLIYRGVLYAGLMLNKEGVFVIEFNARFGDPETQAILPAIDAQISDLLVGAASGNLPRIRRIKPTRWAVCVVAASGGYPDSYETGKAISGIARASERPGVVIFHAGTKRIDEAKLVTAGGRVLGITGTGSTLREARRRAYEASHVIRFAGMHLRTDIGLKGLRRLRNLGVTKA
jgi:phosphoribosylamine--glycine ligase